MNIPGLYYIYIYIFYCLVMEWSLFYFIIPPFFRGKKGGTTGPVPFIRWLRHRFPGSAVRVRGRCHGAPLPHSRKDPKNPGRQTTQRSSTWSWDANPGGLVVWKSCQFSDVSDWNSWKRNLEEVNLLLKRRFVENSNMALGSRFPIIEFHQTWPKEAQIQLPPL